MLRLRSLAGVVCCAATLAAPVDAFAGTLTRGGDGIVRATFADSVKHDLGISIQGAEIHFNRFGSAEVLTPTTPCGTVSATVVQCPLAGTTSILVTGAEGVDDIFVLAGVPPTHIDARGGADEVSFNNANGSGSTDTGAGDDRVDTARDVNAVLDVRLGPGEDLVINSASADTIRGGPGEDLVTYAFLTFGPVAPEHGYIQGGRSEPLRVTLDNIPGDGADGEADDVGTDVERLIGGVGDDVLIGSSGANVLRGLSGNDTLDGGLGIDTFIGEEGDDTIRARDDVAEGIACDEGNDGGEADDIDSATECEGLQRFPAQFIDGDGDGVRRPTDCNDANPAVWPGAAEVADNGVDEDCDGADLVDLDRDRDGIRRPLDCNDANPAVRPGTPEILGNRVDEDCDGRADPFPSMDARLPFLTKWRGTQTRFTQLRLTRLAGGESVELSCRGRGCPLRRKRTAAKRGQTILSLLPLLRGRSIRAGAELAVTVTDARGVLKLFRFEIRNGAGPLQVIRCSSPPDNRLRRC